MNDLSRFPGTTLSEDRREEALCEAEDAAAAEFAPLIEAIERAQVALLEIKAIRPADWGQAEAYLTDALTEVEGFQKQARREAAAGVMEAAE